MASNPPVLKGGNDELSICPMCERNTHVSDFMIVRDYICHDAPLIFDCEDCRSVFVIDCMEDDFEEKKDYNLLLIRRIINHENIQKYVLNSGYKYLQKEEGDNIHMGDVLEACSLNRKQLFLDMLNKNGTQVNGYYVHDVLKVDPDYELEHEFRDTIIEVERTDGSTFVMYYTDGW